MSSLYKDRIHGTVFRMQTSLGLSDEDFASLLGETPRLYAKIKHGKEDLTVKQLENLCSATGANIHLLLTDMLNIPTLVRRFHGDDNAIPDHYAHTDQMLGRARAIKAVYEFAKSFHGLTYANSLIRWAHLTPQYFANPSKPVSPLILIDLLAKLKQDKFENGLIRFIGTMNYQINAKTPLGTALAKKNSVKAVYRSLHEEFRDSYDQLFHYRLMHISDSGCTIAIRMRDKTRDLFRTKLLGNEQVCLYKQGVYASFTASVGVPFARIKESQCLYRGDSCCKYHLSWRPTAFLAN